MVVDFDYSKIEGFQWDKGNLEHIRKHKVLYTECEEVFSNTPLLVNEDKKHSRLEERFQALGKTNNGRFIFVAYTVRKNKIRIISSRDQNKKERYELLKKEVKPTKTFVK
jgi:uncharacterized DUF497 family protein